MPPSVPPISAQEEEFFLFALDIVKEAGVLVKNAFSKPIGNVYTKSSATDFVTETDQAVEKLLISELSRRFPDHKFIGEETAATGKTYELTNDPTWIIDPIDGTTNFVHRIPCIGICVGLAINKCLRAGIVYNPVTDELYSAMVGKGAFKNGFPIRVSTAKAMNEAIVCQSLGQHNLKEKGQEWLNVSLENQKKSVLKGVHGLRAFGAASINMVYLAQGSVDGYVEYGLHSWDMAAAVVIIREAGGVVIDPSGKEFDLMSRKVLCAGTQQLTDEFSKMLTDEQFEREIPS